MTDDRIEALRAEVARRTGGARTRPLLELGAALGERYWRIGPGSPAGLPVLDEAVRALDEAYGLIEPQSFLHSHTAGQLGLTLAVRHGVHQSSAADRERAIPLLEQALAAPQPSAVGVALQRLLLAQMLLNRALGFLQSPEAAMRLLQAGPPPAEAADAERAAACVREVVADPAVGGEMRSMAETMLELVDLLGGLLGGAAGPTGGVMGLDLNRMVTMVSGLRDLQQKAATRPMGEGFGRFPSPFSLEAEQLAGLDPLERPVMVVEASAPATAAAPPPVRRPRPSPGADEIRAALLHALPGRSLAGVGPVLRRQAPTPDVAAVDELAALAHTLVHAPGATGADHLLLAVALYLRSRVDPGGWGCADDADDVAGAGRSLVAAAPALVAGPADALAVAVRLAAALDGLRSGHRVGDELAGAFTDVAAAVSATGADGLLFTGPEQVLLDARSGRFGDLDHLAGARLLVVGDGPVPERPTVSHLRTAAQVLTLAGRRRRPVTEAAVFVANPRHDRKQATLDAMVLRRTFYPGSVGLGEVAEHGDGAGTPAEVLARLDASLLDLGCGVTDTGGLELAGGVLDAATLASGDPAPTGGLAVLPLTDTGSAALTDALLATRFTGVIGFRFPVPEHVASVLHHVLHTQLVDERRDPASAVAAVRRWLADPHRTLPDHLPSWYGVDAADLDDPSYRDALVHHGVL